MELKMEVILKYATNALHCFIVVCGGLHVTFVPIRLHNMVANTEQLVPQIGSVSPMFFAGMLPIWFVDSATEQNDTLRQNVFETKRQQSYLRCRSNSEACCRVGKVSPDTMNIRNSPSATIKKTTYRPWTDL